MPRRARVPRAHAAVNMRSSPHRRNRVGVAGHESTGPRLPQRHRVFVAFSSPRFCHADRERVARILRDRAAVGRLTTEDLDERTGRAFGARTLGELDALLSDLPREPRHGPAPATAVLMLLGGRCPLGAGRRRHRDDRDSLGARLDLCATGGRCRCPRARLAARPSAARRPSGLRIYKLCEAPPRAGPAWEGVVASRPPCSRKGTTGRRLR